MKNTDFMNLSLPEGADKIDVEILNSDFKKLENEASKHYIQQQIEVDGTATIIGSIGPYVQLENLTDNILNVSIGDELVVLMKGDNRKIRTITNANFGIVTSGAVKVTYYVNARTYADENFYKKEKVDELLSNVEATVEVDAELSETSENPVQNKVITAELASYATTEEVESKVAEKVAEIVAGAPEDFDTLKEMSDWLNQHEDSAAAMNSAIQKNAADIATANAAITKNAEDVATANTNIQATKNDVLINQSAIGLKKKNLLNNTAKSTITNGITFTVNDDKTITVSGTATATTAFEIGQVANVTGNCILSGCPSGGTFETYALAVYSSGGTLTNIVDYGNKKTGDFTNQLGTVKIRIATGTTVDNLVFAPMLRYANITDDTYEPYQADINTRISALETLSDAVYKYHRSSYCTIDGYVLRVGNQVHLNLTVTFHTACGEWYGGVINLPFNTKTPDNSTRYTIKQTQSDGRETSIYLQMGGASFYSSTAFKKGDIITIPPMILDMYVEATATTTEGGE